MFCENCGNKVPDGAKFCDSCGAPLQLTESAQDLGYQQSMGNRQDTNYQQGMDYQQGVGCQQDADYQQGVGCQQDADYQQGVGCQQDADYQQGVGCQQNTNYQQSMGNQRDVNYQQGMGYQQNMNYQQQYAPRKPIPKKYLIIGGAVAAACLVLAIAIPLISSAIQSSKDKKNAELYEQYVEELETTNQQAAQDIMDQIAGTTGSDDAIKNSGVITPEGVDAAADDSETAKAETEDAVEVKPTATPTPEPTQEEKKESTYLFIMQDCTWSQAQAICAEMGGHLVHFDSEGEVELVLEQIAASGLGDKGKFWIGGTRDTVSGSVEYHWVNADGTFKDGAINTESHWMTGEPSLRDDSLGIDEDKMMLYKLNSTGQWVWNDAPDNILEYLPSYSGTVGFICEIEG